MNDRRLNPFNVMGFVIFTVGILKLLVAGLDGQIYSESIYMKSASSIVTLVYVCATFMIVIIYLDLWYHEEDVQFEQDMVQASKRARIYDFVFRIALYGYITFFLVQKVFGGMVSPYGIDPVAIDMGAIMVASLMSVTWCYRATSVRTGQWRSAISSVSFEKKWKFLVPHIAIFALLFFSNVGIVILVYSSEIGSALNLMLGVQETVQIDKLVPSKETVGSGGVSVLLAAVVIVTGVTVITRSSEWHRVLVKGRIW